MKEAQKIAKELRGQQDATTDDEMPGLKDTRDDEQPVRDPGIWMQTVEDTLQTREYVLAAGEKRPAGNDAPDAKRVAGDARERQPTTALDEIRMRRKVAAAHAPAEVDHLREVGGGHEGRARAFRAPEHYSSLHTSGNHGSRPHVRVLFRRRRLRRRPQAESEPGVPRRPLAHGHRVHGVRLAHDWHRLVHGHRSTPGVGIDAVSNVSHGEFASMFAMDMNRDVFVSF